MFNQINKIVKEWSYNVDTGMPDVNNPLHIIKLKQTLYEMKYSRTFIRELLRNLRQEAKAQVIAKTLKKAKEKADLGQTYSSPASKKVYKKGEEGEEGADGDKSIDKEKEAKQKEKERKKQEKLERETEAKKPIFKNETKYALDQVAWENKVDKNTFTLAFERLVDGESLSDDELAIINKYAAIKDSNSEVAIYFSNRTPGDFRQGVRFKVELGTSASAKNLRDRMADAGMEKGDPVTTAESVPAKLITKASSLGKVSGGKTRKNKIEHVKNSKGTVTEVTIVTDDGPPRKGNKMRRQPIPSKDELIAEILEYKNQGLSDEDAVNEAEKKQAGIKRYNRLIDAYAKGDVMETVELVEGADVSTLEGREKLAKEGPILVSNALQDMIANPKTQAEQEVIDRIGKLGGIKNPDDYEKEAMDILKRMSEVASIKKGAPDIAEALVLCAMNKKGVPTVAPAGETFRVSDLIQLAEEDLDPNDPDYIKKIVAGGPTVIFMTTAGGLSVKKDGGAASGFDAKLDLSTFKHSDTKGHLRNILDMHNNFIATTKKGEELSQDRIDEGRGRLDATEQWAREQGLVDDDDLVFPNGRTTEEWANDSVSDWQSKGTLPPDCSGKNSKVDCITEENKRLLIEGLNQYARGGLMAQAIHNNDLDFQDYHNANANTKTGKLELSDGIECLNDMAFSANPGFKLKKDRNGNFVMRPNAVYAGNLHKRCR